MATANQVTLDATARRQLGKGPTGRLRKDGQTPAILYGYKADPTPVSVDALALYHVLHTAAGLNVLIDLRIDGDRHLCVARDIQCHPVLGEVTHVDLVSVDRDTPILVEVPVHLTRDEEAGEDGGVVNQILHTVPLTVRPLEVPNFLELDIAGMEIGDVKRVEHLVGLPEGAELDIELDRTVVTVNPPTDLDALLEEAEEVEEGLLEEMAEEAEELAQVAEEEAEAEGEGEAGTVEASDEATE